MSRLGIKILIVFLVISLGGLTLTSYFINRSINTNFMNYLDQKRKENDQQIVEVIENLYQERGSWSELIPELMNLDIVSRVFIKIENSNGKLVYNSFQSRQGNGMMWGMGMMQGRMRHYYEQDLDESYDTRSYPLTVNDRKVGRVFISSPEQRGLLSPIDEYFREKINKAILWAAGLIALLTIVVSYYFSRRMSRPLVEMSQVSEEIAEGRFNQRVKVSSRDELGRLGTAFNEMAEKLEHLEKIRKESTSNLAHELRTPLTTMRSYIEAMEDGVIPLNKGNISNLYSELMRLVRLVDHLGELAEAEGKTINLSRDKLKIGQIIKEIGNRYIPLAREKNINFGINILDEDFYIAGDRDSIEQIFSNLFSNAIKYTNVNGEVQVNMREKAGQLRIEVKDTGIGIDRKDLSYIFERFYRADKSRSRKTGGTGIGLTVTRELVEAHEGEIYVESVPGVGTTFIVLFPLSHYL